MKNLLYVFALLLFVSCNKVSNDNITLNSASSELLKNQDKQQQQSMFRLLNPEEKSNLWKNKFKNYLLNKNLNVKQITYINELINLIKPELYVSGNKYKGAVDEPLLKRQAIELFGLEPAQSLLTTMSTSDDQSVEDEISSGESCTCSKSSDWCSNSLKCSTWSCSNTSSGCGTFWGYQCDGKCYF